jgi:ADP-ribosylglycohydrolase
LGAILGFAIGDAFGMPVAGWSAQTITDWYGPIRTYQGRTFSDGTEVQAGEITDDTELALCIIESVTASHGDIDIENIAMRMAWLTRGDSRRWLHETTVAALEGPSEASDYRLPLRDDEVVGSDILARGMPIGLLHSMGPLKSDLLRSDVEAVTRITHGSPLAITLVETVSRLVAGSARGDQSIAEVVRDVSEVQDDGEVKRALGGDYTSAGEAAVVLAEAVGLARDAENLGDLLSAAVAIGGATDSRAALAASLFAGNRGSQAIPQPFIDGLESRIYVSLAVPWFYRTVARRNGRAIELRMEQGPFPGSS